MIHRRKLLLAAPAVIGVTRARAMDTVKVGVLLPTGVGALHATISRLAQASHSLHPSKDFFDPLSNALTALVAALLRSLIEALEYE